MSAVMSEVSVKSECPLCNKSGRKLIILRKGKMVHQTYRNATAVDPDYTPCLNYDSECRHIGEPFGWFGFALRPRRRRNGRLAWLVSIERHDDGTVTLGNRAH